MENKETAVDWLFKQLWEQPKDKFTWYAILKQANKMFEQELIEAYDAGTKDKELQQTFDNPKSRFINSKIEL
jgi:hypothetical protein